MPPFLNNNLIKKQCKRVKNSIIIKLKEYYKERQTKINEEIKRYTNLDENYYIYEIFKSFEVLEKRQLMILEIQM